MEKIIALLLIVTICIGLAACGSNTSGTTNAALTAAAPVETAADAESTTPSASGNESAAERQAAADTKGSTPSVSADGRTVMNSISTNAGYFNGDTSTSEGRATYLLWMFGNMMDGRYEGDFLHNQETVTIWADADLKVVNDNI